MIKGTRPVVLCILDGWGHRESCEDNAICQARTPVLDGFMDTCPHGLIDASELAVGLPSGQMGNSEVGHMNLGAGRVVLQDLPRIDQAIAEGVLKASPALNGLIEALKATGGTAHILGLLSPGGVHSHQDHMAALAETLSESGLPVAVHGFLDGRDTPPRSALDYIADFEAATRAPIATLCGRYYAMDRDKRWERVTRAYDALVEARGMTAPDARTAVEQSYAAGKGDEFLEPTVIGGYGGMRDGDGLIMANFRADRAREILSALLVAEFDGFARPRVAGFAAAVGMVSYSAALDGHLATLFPPLDLHQTLGEVVSQAGLRQLRIAETEKYAHVTFFFNGGREAVFPGEERILVPSPRVATYDLQPEIGHTGDLAAAVAAVETVDACLGRLAEAVTKAGGALIITADHGNAEQMMDRTTGQAHTAHTMNQVPVILVNAPETVTALTDGRLADIAPSVLDLMGLEQPAEMAGRSLLCRGAATSDAAAE